VVSHVRVGEGAHSPLVAEGEADLVIALERHEALRAMNEMLGDSATMIWYDAVWQPLDIRLGKAPLVSVQSIEAEAARRGIRLHRVFRDDLEDPRTQNTAVLAKIASKGLIPGVTPEHYRQAMADLMEGGMLERNLALFERLLMGDPPR
jgi:indolepyruvate ferredoxin oxidoreductase beta subunit